MAKLKSNPFDNLTIGIQKFKYKDCNSFLAYESVSDNFINCNCLLCNKNYSIKNDENLKSSETIKGI